MVNKILKTILVLPNASIVFYILIFLVGNIWQPYCYASVNALKSSTSEQLP